MPRTSPLSQERPSWDPEIRDASKLYTRAPMETNQQGANKRNEGRWERQCGLTVKVRNTRNRGTHGKNAMWNLELGCHESRNYQKLRERSRIEPFLASSVGAWLCWHFDLGLSSFQGCETVSVCSLRHSVCGALLRNKLIHWDCNLQPAGLVWSSVLEIADHRVIPHKLVKLRPRQ